MNNNQKDPIIKRINNQRKELALKSKEVFGLTRENAKLRTRLRAIALSSGSAERLRTMAQEAIDNFFFWKKPQINISDDNILLMAKGLLFAEQAIDLDMGDGEPTFQCCNSVCGHNCLLSQAADIAKKITNLTSDDLVKINNDRAHWKHLHQINTTEIRTESDSDNDYSL